MAVTKAKLPPHFDAAFKTRLRDLLVWRRDVRRFKHTALPPGTLEHLIETACLAPSVGLSQPWRFVVVDDVDRRAAVLAEFERCNADALKAYSGETAARYARLKLAGLTDAPTHLAVFADRETLIGRGLGRKTMPEMADYSVVAAETRGKMILAGRAYLLADYTKFTRRTPFRVPNMDKCAGVIIDRMPDRSLAAAWATWGWDIIIAK